jgi:hypothetical protein
VAIRAKLSRLKNKSPLRGFWTGRSEGEGLGGRASLPDIQSNPWL